MIKYVASKVIIQDWEERIRVNASLPVAQRKVVEATVEDLQLPVFQSAAIGALHEASEAFLVGQYKLVII